MLEFLFASNESVLLVGEGNFSFCHSIVERMRSSGISKFTNFFASCLEKEENSIISPKIKQDLLNAGIKLLFEVDARKLSVHPDLRSILFNKILFNFPHVGGKMKIHLNRQLLQDFFAESSLILVSGGDIIVTLCAGQGGTPADKVKRKWEDSWQIVEMAARAGLVLKETRKFPHELLDSYTSIGYRGTIKSFNTKEAIIHIFRVGLPLTMDVDGIVERNRTLHFIDGVLMPYTYKNKIINNPYLNACSPQSFFVDILIDICKIFDSDYEIVSESSLFATSSHYPDQVQCIVDGDICYLRKTLLHHCEIKDDKHRIIKGLIFNEFNNDFSLAPVECHVAVFGPRRNEIISLFIKKIKCLFYQDLSINQSIDANTLDANEWFQLKYDKESGIEISIDRIIATGFNINWRQLWCPHVFINVENEFPLLQFPSLYPQTFVFDTTFISKNDSLNITNFLITVQQINDDLIESVCLLSEYWPEHDLPRYCFRFVYKSYYSALCRKKALLYHNLIGKVIEHLLDMKIV